MASFYGVLEGQHGDFKVSGDKYSGVMAKVQSWEGSIEVSLRMVGNEIYCRILAGKGLDVHIDSSSSMVIYDSPLEKLVSGNIEMHVKKQVIDILQITDFIK